VCCCSRMLGCACVCGSSGCGRRWCGGARRVCAGEGGGGIVGAWLRFEKGFGGWWWYMWSLMGWFMSDDGLCAKDCTGRSVVHCPHLFAASSRHFRKYNIFQLSVPYLVSQERWRSILRIRSFTHWDEVELLLVLRYYRCKMLTICIMKSYRITCCVFKRISSRRQSHI
jgi:hypothetical protein